MRFFNICILLSLALVSSAGASAFTASEKNMEMIAETATTTRSMLQQFYGPTFDTLSYSGAYSDTNWTMTLGGVYAGNSVSITFTGTFNVGTDIGSYTSSGVAGVPVTGLGNWSFFDIDANSVGMPFAVHLAAGAVSKDVESVTSKTLTNANGVWTSFGEVYYTTNGVIVGGRHPQSDSGSGTPSIRTVNVSLPDDPTLSTTIFDTTLQTFTGTVVPEPTSGLLVTIGLGLLGWCLRRRC